MTYILNIVRAFMGVIFVINLGFILPEYVRYILLQVSLTEKEVHCHKLLQILEWSLAGPKCSVIKSCNVHDTIKISEKKQPSISTKKLFSQYV